MLALRSQILSIEKYLSLYGECLHPALFQGESCRICHSGVLLATCRVHEGLVNSFVPVRQITLQIGTTHWALRQTLMGLGRVDSPFVVELQKECTPELIEFEVRFREREPDICLPAYNLTLDGPLTTWLEIKQATLGIGALKIGCFPLYRSLFQRETALGIGLGDEVANSVMAALEQGKSCWMEEC